MEWSKEKQRMCKILKLMDQEDDLYSSILQGCTQTENTLSKTKRRVFQ